MEMHNVRTRIGEIFFALCKSIESPVALGAWLRFKYNQLALAEMEIHPSDYLDRESFEDDYLIVSFLSKGKMLETGLDLEVEAMKKFTTSEDQCGVTNRNLKNWRSQGIKPELAEIFHLSQRKISRLLGPFSLFCVDPGFGWGPGATSDISRRRAFVDTKMCELPISVTRRCQPLLASVIESDLHWSCSILGVDIKDLAGPYNLLPSCFFITEECIIDTVPKNAKSHRVIAKEPRGNGFLQKGFGHYFRRRLQSAGIDLNSQEANQVGAKNAYEQKLATIDLKAASDSIAIELVFELLPIDWALALNDVRSHRAVLPSGETITLQKFSSMGNGFTFELETLIFWAITDSIEALRRSGAKVLVYGDDIICSQSIADEVVSTLAAVGFQTNKDKSFLSGNFYESCGKHYFKGTEVTPIYQKEPVDPTDEVPIQLAEKELLRCGNRLIRLAYRRGSGFRLCPKLLPPWNASRRSSRLAHFQIPFGEEGDDGWLLPAAYFNKRPQDINLGIQCQVIDSRSRRFIAHEPSLLAWAMRVMHLREKLQIPLVPWTVHGGHVIETAEYAGFVTGSPKPLLSTPRFVGELAGLCPAGSSE